MPQEIGIIDLLRLCGFDPNCRSKLVRHQDKRWPSQDLLYDEWLDAYQKFQTKPVFDGLDYIISFVGVGGTQARLVGVYKVGRRRPGHTGELPADCPHVEWKRSTYFYELERQAGFETLENRAVIDWGRGTLAWHQHTQNKRVIQVLPIGHLGRVFSDYFDFALPHKELRYLCRHQDANSEWRARLSAVAGIYLILATKTGHQYVGSASGVNGVWGRWEAYASNGHGGNVRLVDLIGRDSDYPDSFVYSLLQILPKTATRAETLRWEQRFKDKLGSMATGLNVN